MKFLAILFSIYILVLTAIPCIDKPDDPTLQKTEVSPQSGSHHQDIDHCSPFCTCNCCSSPKIQQEVTIDFNSYPVLLGRFAEVSFNMIAFHLADIWQPPQLS